MSLIIETEEFNGPMDLLLNLVEKEKIDIENVDLAKITNKFIEEVENLKNHSTKDLTDFIYLASTLLYIKSKKILPKNDFDEDDQQLIELENISSKHFRKIQEDLSAYQSEKENLIVPDVNLLSETLLEILNREDNRIVIEETVIIEAEEYKIEDCIEDILWKVEKNRTYSFSSFLSQKTNRNEVISVFLALLELLKSNILKVVKNEDNMEILMR